jgi:hypothetical protein
MQDLTYTQGKTTYLYLRLVQCMITGSQCLFQTMDGTVYHISESITVVDSWLDIPIVAFVDADKLTLANASRQALIPPI